jgi:hypothetical protein
MAGGGLCGLWFVAAHGLWLLWPMAGLGLLAFACLALRRGYSVVVGCQWQSAVPGRRKKTQEAASGLLPAGGWRPKKVKCPVGVALCSLRTRSHLW